MAFLENGGDDDGGNVSETEKCSNDDGENAKCSDSTVTEIDKSVVVEIEEHAEKIPEHSKIAEFYIQRGDKAERNRFDENEREKTVIEEEEEDGKKLISGISLVEYRGIAVLESSQSCILHQNENDNRRKCNHKLY